MKSEQWRPLLGFVFVSVLCAVLMTVSATRGFGLDLFRPGRPIAAPRVVEPFAPRPTPAVRAPIMVPAELSAVRPTAGVPARSTRPQASRSSRSSWSAGPVVDTPGARGHGAPVPTPTPTTVPVVPTTEPTTVPTARPDKEAEKAQREAEREAEKAQRDAERQAEKAQRDAEREAEKAQRDAEREAEKAQRDAEREAEKAQRDAEREAEKAQRDAEREAGRQPVQTTSDRTAS